MIEFQESKYYNVQSSGVIKYTTTKVKIANYIVNQNIMQLIIKFGNARLKYG